MLSRRGLALAAARGVAAAVVMPAGSDGSVSSDSFSGGGRPLARVINAVDNFHADGTGTRDCTAELQSALIEASGHVLVVPPGNYRLSATLRIAGGTTLRAHGARFFTTASAGFNFFNNRNFEAPYGAVKIDHNIVFEGGTYDYGLLNDGSTHAIAMRMAADIVVRDALFLGGNDATAMLASQSTIVENCRAFGQNNCAYDHWEGPQDAVVRGCHAFIRGRNANGILFTGVGEPGTRLTASGASFEDNWIVGLAADECGPGILINADGAYCSTENAKIVGNHLVNTGGGVVVSGAGGRHEIAENEFVECGASSARGGDCLVRISPEIYNDQVFGPPNDCVVRANRAIGCRVDSVEVGLVQLNGTGHVVGPLMLIRTSVADGVVFWCPTPSNRIRIEGPVIADAATIAGVTQGFYMGDRSTIIETPNPWKARPMDSNR
jgi:hypothetical protein